MLHPQKIELAGRAGMALMVIAFTALVSHQVIRPLAQARRHLGDFREAVDLLSQGEEGIDRLDRQVREVRAQIQESEERLPAAPNLEVFLNRIAALAHETRVNVVDLKPQGVTEHRLFREMEIQVRVDGSFRAVYDFLDRVEEAEQLSRVEQLRIAGNARGEPVAADIRLALYFAPVEKG